MGKSKYLELYEKGNIIENLVSCNFLQFLNDGKYLKVDFSLAKELHIYFVDSKVLNISESNILVQFGFRPKLDSFFISK